MKKSILLSCMLSLGLYASTDTAISYLQNYNKAILVKDLEKRINNFSSSISTYILNTGGNPILNNNQLKLNFNKSEMASNINLFKEDMQLLDGTQCSNSPLDANVCSDSTGIQYSFKYDSSNKIPIGLIFKPIDILGSTTLDFANEKVIAYLNANNIILDAQGNLVKLFNDTIIGLLKQTYYIVKNNPNITFVDTTTLEPSSFVGQNKVFYSPDGKGAFLIYQPTIDPTTNQAIWKVIGEPEITLTVNSTNELNGDLVVPVGQKVTVLNDNGKAIEYTMQQSSSNVSGTSSVAWNKTSGLYEKNYYFSPIRITDISMGVSAELQKALGSWDSHTYLRDTYIDSINYDPIYQKDKKTNNDLLDSAGYKILEAQSLSSIVGHIRYDGGLSTSVNGRVYYEILNTEIGSNGYVRFIGHSYLTPEISSCGGEYLSCDVVIVTPNSSGFGTMMPYNHNVNYKGVNYPSLINNINANTTRACHHDTIQCVYASIQSISGNLNNMEINMKLSCENDSRITYKDNNKFILKEVNEKVDVNVKPLNTGGHLITYKKLDGTNDYQFVSSNFDLTYITIDTFGNLQCIKKDLSSNYKPN